MSSYIDQITEHIRQSGGRMTPQRRMIFEALECLGCHPSAEEIFAVVTARDPGIHLSTVYRTLRWMEQEGLVLGRRFDETERTERFDPVLAQEHHHFVCNSCKQVIEFESEPMQKVIDDYARRFRCVVQSSSLVLYGLCPACRENRRS